MTAAPATPSPASGFGTTRWTLVHQARGDSPEARAALADLCAAYRAPVASFIRQITRHPEEVEDLTQEFFARVLAGSGFDRADPARGRFRTYLRGAVKHFLHADDLRRRAAKRGGGTPLLSLDEPANHDNPFPLGLALPDPRAEMADLAFDRRWAHRLLELALARLRRDLAAENRERHFDSLKDCLLGAAPTIPLAERARQFGLGESALKVAVHRLRKRFRVAVKAEIADTLADPAQVDEELAHLLAILGDDSR